ncbi:MAG TPA: helix-turn-helix transcriptional regulator, partial [Clostridia bacterium]|nr:helix-turn-helix transcriptional regulator [Clostridia bacterium]
MDHEAMVQSVLDDIDRKIKEPIRAEELARAANYSTYHFCRLFAALTGTPVMGYVTRRKLEHALHDLSRGMKILDVALDYGFETHAGFTRAFKKYFGYPPSLYLHIQAKTPERATIVGMKAKHGGMDMTPYIIVMTPFTVAGRTLRQKLPNVKRHADIPAYCFGVNSVEAETAALLLDTSELFSKSNAIKHCEVSMCYDVDPDSGTFTYFLGRGIFH